MSEEKVNYEVEEDFEFNDDDEEGEKVTQVSMEDMIQQASQKTHQQLTAYVDKRMEKLNEKVIDNTKNIESLNDRVVLLEQLNQSHQPSQANGTLKQHQEENKPQGIMDATFGTVGGLLHGIVDTTAYVLESTIDLVTLGKARRQPPQ